MGSGQKKLRLFFIVSIVFMLIISAASFTMVRYFINTQEGVATIINMSGRQRMFSQRIAMLATEVLTQKDSEERKKIINSLDKTLS